MLNAFGKVSIRSPRRSEGRYRSVGRLRIVKRQVSIRSPRRSEGRFISLLSFGVLDDVSIRSPRRSEGRS